MFMAIVGNNQYCLAISSSQSVQSRDSRIYQMRVKIVIAVYVSLVSHCAFFYIERGLLDSSYVEVFVIDSKNLIKSHIVQATCDRILLDLDHLSL